MNSVKAKANELSMGMRATESHAICSLELSLAPASYLCAQEQHESLAAGIPQHTVSPLQQQGRGGTSAENQKFVTCPEMTVIKSRLQKQFPGTLEDLLKVFSLDDRSKHREAEVLAGLGARSKRKKLICRRGRELR